MQIDDVDFNEFGAGIDATERRWVAGDTAVARLPDAERDALLGNWLAEQPTPGDRAQSGASAYGFDHPHACDLRSGGFISPVRNQGACSTGIAFAVLAAVEGTCRRRFSRRNDPIDLSEAHLFYFHARADGIRCKGGWSPSKTLDACRDKGVVDEACYPYTPGDQDCSNLCSSWRTRLWHISGWRSLTSTAGMRTWISTRGPLVAAFRIRNDFFKYASGIYEPLSGADRGVVPACVVGYDDPTQHWICKLSWGAEFGEQGYARIAYGTCDIESMMYAIEGVAKEWLTNVWVNAVWSNGAGHSAWVHFKGHGWRKVGNTTETIVTNMLALLIAAKTANRPVNVRQGGGAIIEAYIL